MPTTYEDIKKTSILRNKFGRRKVGLYEESARFATGGAARPAAVAKKFAKAKKRGKFIFDVNGELAAGKKNENKR